MGLLDDRLKVAQDRESEGRSFAAVTRRTGPCETCGRHVDPGRTELVKRGDDEKPRWRAGIVRNFDTASLPDLFYCPRHAHLVVERERTHRAGFRFTGEERVAILTGERPQILRAPTDPKAELHRSYELSPLVSVTLTRQGINQRSQVHYRYTVADQRLDAPRLLRRSPPALRPEQARNDRVHPPTKGEIEQAAYDSAYTSSGGEETVIADAGEAPSPEFLRRQSASARLRRAEAVRSEIEDAA